MWKVSVLYVAFALALIGSLWIGEKTLMQRMVGKELDLPQEVWKRLTWFCKISTKVNPIVPNNLKLTQAASVCCAFWQNCTAVSVASETQSNSVNSILICTLLFP
jgi:intracellular septation protein A